MNDFAISVHPMLPSVARTAQLKRLVADTVNKELTLYLKVKHTIDGVYVPEMDKDIQAVADNVVEGSPYINPETNEPLGEYDYWEYSVEHGATLLQLLASGIIAMDANGKINEKCVYNS